MSGTGGHSKVGLFAYPENCGVDSNQATQDVSQQLDRREEREG